jgi:protein-tyrosine phosphatase
MLIELPYKFPGKIYRSPMPFSQFDRQNVWPTIQEEGVNLAVILTEKQEYLVYAKKDLPDFYRSEGLDVKHIPVPDFGIPDDRDSWQEGLDLVKEAALSGKKVVVHCLAGTGRTGTFLACLAKENLDLSGEEAIRWVRESIPGAMENGYQEDFVINY